MEARRHDTIGSVQLSLGLLDLVWRQVELVLLGDDRLPREVLADCFVEVLLPGLVDGEEHQRVAVEARRRAS